VNAILIAFLSLGCLALGYKYYGDLISLDVFGVDSNRVTPAHNLRDGVDYVPSNKWVLFGHHFASISGLGPIVGPAIAVIWGWVPAVLWVIFGTLIVGAVHDFTTLGLSLRHRGRSVGDVASRIINPRSRLLFLILIFFLISLAMGVFAYVIAILFASMYPQTVVPIFALMVIAMAMGSLVRFQFISLGPASVVGFLLVLLSMWGGLYVPTLEWSVSTWTYLLMGYAFFASVLPVWFLLQPRDYLNSFLLYLGLFLMYGGMLWMNPTISAPTLNTGPMAPADLPPLFPVLFITIACGAVSGFHSLVSSGTTAKQLDSEDDAKLVGFGGMVAEGTLALIVILACTAGLGNLEVWRGEYYSSWAAVDGLGPKLKAFIDGGAAFIDSFASAFGVSLSEQAGAIFISLIVVSFAMTTLDSGTRLLRYNIEELIESLTERESTPSFVNRWTTSLVGILAIGFFALLEIPVQGGGGIEYQPAGIVLWVLFGASNQLLASLGLLTVTVYFYQTRRPVIYTVIPMVFMVIVTTMALFGQFYQQLPRVLRRVLADWLGSDPMVDQPGSWVIFSLVVLIMALALWFILEAIQAFQRIESDSTAPAEPVSVSSTSSIKNR